VLKIRRIIQSTIQKIKNHMKSFITLTMLLAFTTASFAQQDTTIQQQTTPTPMQAKPNTHWKDSDLYKKSKTQKIVAWSLIGGGTIGLFATLIADANQGTYNSFSDVITGEKPAYKSYTTSYVIFSAVVGGGFYLMIRSTMNKKKAMATSVFMDMEKAQVLQGAAFSYQSFPVVGLKIPL
jgi:hypothetical protein